MKYQEIKSGLSVRCAKHDIVRGMILDKVPGSYTKAVVCDMHRGKGWDENTQSYKGVAYKTKDKEGKIIGGGWERGENYGYNEEYVCHIKELEII